MYPVLVDGHESPPYLGIIYYSIVDKCSRMQKFNHSSRHITALIDIAKEACRHKNQRGTNFFAFLPKQILHNFVEHKYIGPERFFIKRAEVSQIIRNGSGNLLKRFFLLSFERSNFF